MPDWTLHHPADRLIWQAPDVLTFSGRQHPAESSQVCCAAEVTKSFDVPKWLQVTKQSGTIDSLFFKQLILRATASFWAVLMEAKPKKQPSTRVFMHARDGCRAGTCSHVRLLLSPGLKRVELDSHLDSFEPRNLQINQNKLEKREKGNANSGRPRSFSHIFFVRQQQQLGARPPKAKRKRKLAY